MFDLRKEQAGTILDIINDILEKGEDAFIAPPDQSIDAVETAVIGEATSYEKAIASARISTKREGRLMIKEAEEAEGEAEEALINKLTINHLTIEAMNNLLWSSIHYRLGEKTMGFDGIGIRPDWKIIGYKKAVKEAISETIADKFKELLETNGVSGIGGIGIVISGNDFADLFD